METEAILTFHGAPAKRVIAIKQANSLCALNYSDRKFVQTRFNSVRNYREFNWDATVEILEKASDDLPKISSLKSGDAVLLVGSGRVLDKQCYEFALKCIDHDIPVYFIRSNSLDVDPRVKNRVWQYNILTLKTSEGTKYYGAPAKYFMEIPRKEDFIRCHFSDDFYALLPGMVPF